MMIFTKLSILFLFLRLFSPSRKARIWIYIGIIMTLLNHIFRSTLTITICMPSDPLDFSRYIGRLNILELVTSVINLLSDFYILLLPFFVVSKLQIHQNRKLGVLAVFSTGAL